MSIKSRRFKTQIHKIVEKSLTVMIDLLNNQIAEELPGDLTDDQMVMLEKLEERLLRYREKLDDFTLPSHTFTPLSENEDFWEGMILQYIRSQGRWVSENEILHHFQFSGLFAKIFTERMLRHLLDSRKIEQKEKEKSLYKTKTK